MKSAPTTEISNQHYEERTVPRHYPKAWVRRQDAAFWRISEGAATARRHISN